jgi:hypothetical protein
VIVAKMFRANGTRKNVVSVRFSDGEMKALAKGARKRGMSLSQFIRGVALADDAVPVVDFDELPDHAKDVLYGYSEGYKAAMGERRRLEEG